MAMAEGLRNEFDDEPRRKEYLDLSFLGLTDAGEAQAQQFHGNGMPEAPGAFGRLNRRHSQRGLPSGPTGQLPDREYDSGIDPDRMPAPYQDRGYYYPEGQYAPYQPRGREYVPRDREYAPRGREYAPRDGEYTPVPRQFIPDPRLNPPGDRHHPERTPGQEPFEPWQLPPELRPEPLEPLHPRTEPFAVGPNHTVIPTLRVDEPEAENDASVYPKNDEQAVLFNRSKDAVVRLQVDNKNGAGTSSGTGFFVSADGQIATAHHVVDTAQEITVQTTDGREYKADVVEKRPTHDVAVLKIRDARGATFQWLPLARETGNLTSGTPVMAIGHPHGWRSTYMSPGSVHTRRTMTHYYATADGNNPNRILLDANVHVEKGNSGSPLLNMKGEAVGLLNLSVSDSAGQFTVVENVRPLVRDESGKKLEDPRGFLPRPDDVIFEERGLKHLAASGMAARTMFSMGGWPSRLGRTATAMYASWEFSTKDAAHFRNALEHGSMPEKVSAGIDVGGDLMMFGGVLASGLPRFRVLGAAVTLAGAAGKLGNHMLSDRRLY